jgi:hypothetical protein
MRKKFEQMNVAQTTIITFLMLLFAWGCNQGSSETPENNESDSTLQEEQMPDQSALNNNQPTQPQSTEVSDSELKQFANAAQQVQSINQEFQQQMLNTLEANGLGAERFNEIQQAQQNPQQESDASKEEMEKYEASIRDFQNTQVQAQEIMEEKIIEAGLTVPRYEEIAMTLQSNPELQAKLQELQQ